MYTVARQSIQVRSQSGHQGFTFTGFHLGDFAFMQDDTTDQLHIIMSQAQGTGRAFAYNRKSFDQQIIQFCTIIQAGAEFSGFVL